MSHRTVVDVQVLDKEAARKTCEALGYEFLDNTGEVKIFDGKVQSKFGFKIPEWRYPVYVDQDDKMVFDNYEGRWGNIEDFNKFRQLYAENVTLSHAERSGYRVLHRGLTEDGTLQLRLGR